MVEAHELKAQIQFESLAAWMALGYGEGFWTVGQWANDTCSTTNMTKVK